MGLHVYTKKRSNMIYCSWINRRFLLGLLGRAYTSMGCREYVLAVIVALLGNATVQAAETDKLAPILVYLRAVQGQYSWDEKIKRYTYSNKVKLDEITNHVGREQVFPLLVDCLDQATLSNSRILGQPVMLGVVCLQALTQIVYYEPQDYQGEASTYRAGYIAPTTTIQELRAAKQAWQSVLENNKYIYSLMPAIKAKYFDRDFLRSGLKELFSCDPFLKIKIFTLGAIL